MRGASGEDQLGPCERKPFLVRSDPIPFLDMEEEAGLMS